MSHLLRNTPVLLFATGCVALAGCGALDRLAVRTDRLEQEIADLHQAQQRLDSRLDEIQIALTTLQARLSEAGPAARPVATASPARPAAASARPAPAPADEKPVVLKLSGREPKSGEGSLRLEPEVSAPDQGGTVEIGLDAQAIVAQFQEGLGLYRGNQLDRARDALETFARRFPEHELTPEAVFFGAQARLQLGDTAEATRRFGEVASRFPKSSRAAEALLMLARCQERLGQAERARSTYLQLVDAYPLSAEASEANRRLSMIR
ncbi:MAG TPA: tetratricopeptide repeat protein [Myxococcota bacterium]|nr:tetratricopeptide repeat protein [Myxococcota bacterium]HRY94779.1 tetratricopeptide repeat protein [Myxococcota bacterium]HSA22700.1 tetratricopeptide repeat protein [Myxococcota bacterium]